MCGEYFHLVLSCVESTSIWVIMFPYFFHKIVQPVEIYLCEHNICVAAFVDDFFINE